MKEDYGIVLDYLPMGKPSDPKGTPLAQILGTSYFTLLEVIPKPSATLSPYERVFIGKGDRPKVSVIKGRIFYGDLTSLAKTNLEEAVKTLVRENEQKYVQFFNNARPITIRLHSLELLPGIGKKHLFAILEEREKAPFKSFDDIRTRLPNLGDPEKIIVGRIMKEIQGNCKYYLFVRPPNR